MTHLGLGFVKIIHAVNEWVGKVIAWLSLGAVVAMFLVVILRFMGIGSVLLQESVMYMHGLLFMLAAGYTLKHNEHVRVDIFYRQFSARKKAVVEILGACFLTLPVCTLIVVMCWPYVEFSWALSEGSREQGGIPFLYVLKTTLVALPILLGLQALAQALDALMYLCGVNPDWRVAQLQESI